jgi:CO/xanthine dehydrogenase Mo-binding subunit
MDNKNPFRGDVMDKITGAAKYSGDYSAAAMVHAKVLWPAVTSAKVLKIDTSKAEKASGMVRVITQKDITGPNVSGMYHVQDRPILVGEGEAVRFAADALALVAAESEAQAERMLDLIEVQYEPLGSPCTWAEAAARGDKPLEVQRLLKGDVEAGFSMAAVVVEESYKQPFLEHAYIEPDAAYADVDNFGTINVYCGTQDITQNQRMISKALGIPASKIHMKSPYVGGGFGGKHSMSVQVYIALLAHVLQRPVRLVWTREECMRYSCKRQSHTTWAKLGLAADGVICAFQARSEWPAGAYYGNYSGAMGSFIGPMCGPYRHENLNLLGNLYYTNSPEIGSFRGVGAPDGTYIIETLLNKAAAELGMDQVEVRRKNWLMEHHEFEQQFPGQNSRNVSEKWLMPETMDRALAEAEPLPKAAKGKKVGRGVACSMPSFCIGNSSLHKASVRRLLSRDFLSAY